MAHRHTARDARTPGWYWSDNDLIDRYGPIIGAYGVAVYSALARYADRDGRAFPSYQKLADQLKTSRPTIVKTIKHLQEAGLIRVESRTDAAGDATSNEYTLIAIASQRHEPALGGKGDLPPSKPDEPQVVKEVYQGGKGGLHEQDSWNKTHDQPPPPAPEPSAPSTSGGGGDRKGPREPPTDSQRALVRFGFSAKVAYEFRDLPLAVVDRELTQARQTGAGAGALTQRWRVELPTLPPARAPDRPDVPPLAAGLPAAELRRLRDKHDQRSPL